MQVGQRDSFGAVPFTSIDFGGQRHPWIAPLLEKGNQLMKERKLVFLQIACRNVELNRGSSVSPRQPLGMLNHVGNRNVQITAAGKIALKGIRLMEQGVEYEEPTR